MHIYRTYYPETQGGLEEVIRQICINTKELGTESKVFCLADQATENPISREEALVYQSKRHLEISSCDISFTCLPEFKRLVDWADLVHYHYPWPYADLLHFMSQVDKPSVLTYHSDIVRQRALSIIYSPLKNAFLQSVDRIVCTSTNYFATSSTLTKFQDKVDVIPIGLDDIVVGQSASDTLSLANALIGQPYFLFVGVLRYYKGLHILLDAMVNAPYRVVIVGSGPTEKALKEQASRLKLDNVTFAGRVSDAEKFQLLSGARGVVFPSYLRSEAFGVTLLEGAMFGKPLISTEVGSGTSHVNIHGKTGIVVAPGSAKSLRTAMDRLYREPKVAARMGQDARDRYLKMFTGKQMGQRYLSLYEELAGTAEVAQNSPKERVQRN